VLSRKKMCYDKKSYTTKRGAELAATYWNLRVYDCPICFCFHTTSKDNIPKFVTEEFMNEEIQRHLKDQRKNIGAENAKLSTKINALVKENKTLWIENMKLRSFVRDSKHFQQPPKDTQ